MACLVGAGIMHDHFPGDKAASPDPLHLLRSARAPAAYDSPRCKKPCPRVRTLVLSAVVNSLLCISSYCGKFKQNLQQPFTAVSGTYLGFGTGFLPCINTL